MQAVPKTDSYEQEPRDRNLGVGNPSTRTKSPLVGLLCFWYSYAAMRARKERRDQT